MAGLTLNTNTVQNSYKTSSMNNLNSKPIQTTNFKGLEKDTVQLSTKKTENKNKGLLIGAGVSALLLTSLIFRKNIKNSWNKLFKKVKQQGDDIAKNNIDKAKEIFNKNTKSLEKVFEKEPELKILHEKILSHPEFGKNYKKALETFDRSSGKKLKNLQSVLNNNKITIDVYNAMSNAKYPELLEYACKEAKVTLSKNQKDIINKLKALKHSERYTSIPKDAENLYESNAMKTLLGDLRIEKLEPILQRDNNVLQKVKNFNDELQSKIDFDCTIKKYIDTGGL